jgi:hypothetical protein
VGKVLRVVPEIKGKIEGNKSGAEDNPGEGQGAEGGETAPQCAALWLTAAARNIILCAPQNICIV